MKTHVFYYNPRWRGWKLRIYCKRKSSEDRLLNRLGCRLHPPCWGDWSRKGNGPVSLKGCDPSPTSGIRKLMSRRFQTKEVDEYLTSKTCYHCHGRLERYRRSTFLC